MQYFVDERLKNLIKTIHIPGTLILIPIWGKNFDLCRDYEQQKSPIRKQVTAGGTEEFKKGDKDVHGIETKKN